MQTNSNRVNNAISLFLTQGSMIVYMLHIILKYLRMVLHILTGYRVLGIVYLDQLLDAIHTYLIMINNTLVRLKGNTKTVFINSRDSSPLHSKQNFDKHQF